METFSSVFSAAIAKRDLFAPPQQSRLDLWNLTIVRTGGSTVPPPPHCTLTHIQHPSLVVLGGAQQAVLRRHVHLCGRDQGGQRCLEDTRQRRHGSSASSRVASRSHGGTRHHVLQVQVWLGQALHSRCIPRSSQAPAAAEQRAASAARQVDHYAASSTNSHASQHTRCCQWRGSAKARRFCTPAAQPKSDLT